MKNLAIAKTAQKCIDQFNPDDVRQWARDTNHAIRRSIYRNLTLNEQVGMFPYGYFDFVDDTSMLINLKTDTTKHIANSYLNMLRHVKSLAIENYRYYEKPDVVSKIASIGLSSLSFLYC